MKIINDIKSTKINIGNDLAKDLSALIKSEDFSGKRILLLTGKKYFDTSFWKFDFFKTLAENQVKISKHVRISPNPTIKTIEENIPLDEIDIIFCVGGGSVIDFGKMLKLKLYPDAKIFVFYTYIGSGSIITPFAVYDNHEFKIGEHSESIIPDTVYINESLIEELTDKQKLAAICDITAHSVESFFSKAASADSKKSALKSITILHKVITDPGNSTAADLIAADIAAAMSESIGGVLFPHAVGHYLTYKFGIDHNVASVYCLGDFLNLLARNNIDVRYFKNYFRKLREKLETADLFPRLNLREDQILELMALVNKYMGFVFDNAPVEIAPDKYLEILRVKKFRREADILENLNKTIERAKRSNFYAERLASIPDKLESLADLRRLPFTTKADLRSAYPFGTLSVGFDEVLEMHTTSGTTGKPTLSFYNENDLTTGSQAIAEAWASFGINANSRVQFVMSYGLFSGAMLNTYALQSLGAFVLPAGIQPIEKQVNLLIDFEIDTMVATPSYLLYLADYLKDHEEYKSKLKLVRAIAAGEIYSDMVRQKIENKLGIKVFDHYGLCEVNTGIAYECGCKNGLHVLDDYVITEIVDPVTGEPMPDGEYGELVLTSLKKEASPIIRYRTGDLTCKMKGRCGCGNNRVRIDRIKSRVDDLMFIRGMKVNPHELKELIIHLVGDNLYCGCIKIKAKKNSIDFVPQISLFVKDEKGVDVDKLKKQVKDRVQVNFEFNVIDHKTVNLFENNKINLVEYVD